MKITGLMLAALTALSPVHPTLDQQIAQLPGSSSPSSPETALRNSKISLLTIITSPDPQTQLMALALTRAAMGEGETPFILLCSTAGDLALKNAPPDSFNPQLPSGASPASMIQLLISEGVQIKICATYLPNRNLDASALASGVGRATPTEVAKLLVDRSVRVLSY